MDTSVTSVFDSFFRPDWQCSLGADVAIASRSCGFSTARAIWATASTSVHAARPALMALVGRRGCSHVAPVRIFPTVASISSDLTISDENFRTGVVVGMTLKRHLDGHATTVTHPRPYK